MLSGFGAQINSSVTDISSELRDVEASVGQFSSLIRDALGAQKRLGAQGSNW